MPQAEVAQQITNEPIAWWILGTLMLALMSIVGWLLIDKLKVMTTAFKEGFSSIKDEVEGLKSEMKDMNEELKETNAFIARQAEKNDNYKAEFEEIRAIIGNQGILIDDIRIKQNEMGVEHLINHPESNLKLNSKRHRID